MGDVRVDGNEIVSTRLGVKGVVGVNQLKATGIVFGDRPYRFSSISAFTDAIEALHTAARAACEQYPAGDYPQAMIELQKAVKAMEGDA